MAHEERFGWEFSGGSFDHLIIDHSKPTPNGPGIIARTHKECHAIFIAKALNAYQPKEMEDAPNSSSST